MDDSGAERFTALVAEYNATVDEQRERLVEMQQILSTCKGYPRVLGVILSCLPTYGLEPRADLAVFSVLTLPIYDYYLGTPE